MKTCPTCNTQYDYMGALSRKDNKTEICSQCGTNEAMDDYRNHVNSALAKQLLPITQDGCGIGGEALLELLTRKINDAHAEKEGVCDESWIDQCDARIEALTEVRYLVAMSFTVYQQQTQGVKVTRTTNDWDRPNVGDLLDGGSSDE